MLTMFNGNRAPKNDFKKPFMYMTLSCEHEIINMIDGCNYYFVILGKYK